MKVILIGAGRYGNGLVGSKYAKGDYFGTKIDSVVDPEIKNISGQENYNLLGAKEYDSFDKIPDENIDENTVVEMAVVPEIIPEIFNRITNRGIKKVILPKPVTHDFASFIKMKKISDEKGIKSVVASNWHYSDITKLTREVLFKVIGGKIEGNTAKKYNFDIDSIKDKFEVENVEIEYSKKHEVLTIDPPAQEMPHALQILYSVGITDFGDEKYYLDPNKQSESAVHVEFKKVPGIKHGITINSDLQKGDKTDLRRERLLKIYLNDDDPEADIIADYDAQFEKGVCTKPASITVDITKDNKTTKLKTEITEDNMDAMYKSMFDYLRGEENNALEIDDYEPIALKISQIQTDWEKALKLKNAKN
ncbi:hypothetical protein IKA15_03985 [bacterium]|nr:hypothetical protein [bacterium]